MDSAVPIRRVDLFATPYCVQAAVRQPETELFNGEIKTFMDHVTEDLIVRVNRYVATAHAKTYEFKAPRDWWQAVKERFAPAWFLKRYPIAYRRETVDLNVEYPDLRIPDQRHRFSVVVRDGLYA